ncbi:N utilization substance protein B [Thalassobacillus devorans]|uniref:Transcription antitermination protein NusB n=1 Tax=Thalassobacillus devorans TaxID=279813 RepID=A0ABQ1P5R2_9BACI|nr:transcription antitermination factor NusB [Thalassobacillus devorans]NIK29596.1 N utilization substance protein B [Thalassobacillus devorans]GGC91316.1 N utilization substance protein B [Thalassobacillus devorans]
MKRHLAREKAFQVLFQVDVNDIDMEEAIEHVLEETKSDAFMEQLIHGVFAQKQVLDEKISNHLENWTIKRLPLVEKTLLRMAVYEMDFVEDVPAQVAINEAVELAKVFGDEKSGKFVNGVLSKMTK